MAIRQQAIVQANGSIEIHSSDLTPGQAVDVIVIVKPVAKPNRARLTARHLLESGMIGLWEGREDLGDSLAFARQLREQAQHQHYAVTPNLQTQQPYRRV